MAGIIAATISFCLHNFTLTFFTLGAAVGHIREMITAHNFAPGNAGVIFWTDILIPLIGFLLLWLQRRYGRPRPASPAAAASKPARLAA